MKIKLPLLFLMLFTWGAHNMALVRGASSFWLKETVSTVWDSFFMGRYPGGSNEAFLLTTHLLKIPTYRQVQVENMTWPLCYWYRASHQPFGKSKKIIYPSSHTPLATQIRTLARIRWLTDKLYDILNWNIIG